MALLYELVRAVVVLAVVWGASAGWQWLREYRRFRRMELAIPGPPSLPVLGNALSFLGIDHNSILGVLLGLWGERRDDISRCSIFNRLLVFVTHPDDMGRVIRDKRFNDKPWFFYSALRDLLGTGSAGTGGDLWKSHRNVVQPTFNPKILDGYVEMFSEETQKFVSGMGHQAVSGEEVAPFDSLHHAVARAVLRATMAITMQPGDKETVDYLVSGFGRALMGIARRTYNILLWPTPIFKLTSTSRFQDEYVRRADEFTETVIGRTEATLKGKVLGAAAGRKKIGKVRKSFLEHVIEGKLRGDVTLPDKEIVDEVKTIYSAAIETSTATSCFIMKIMSLRPDVQERAYQELREVFGDSDRVVTAKDLSKLVYLERVLKETLRMFPPLPMFARAVHEECDFNGRTIPAGSILILNIFGTHRDPRFHENPLHFDPDRFERGRQVGRHPFCYIPFSAGPRNCVGQRSGVLQVKTVVANTLRAYRVLPVDDGITDPSQFPLTSDLALRYVGGVRVKLEPRQKNPPPNGA